MSHARRYHEPGVGSRTGLRMAEGAVDLDDFYQAGRRAMIGGGSARSSMASRRSSISSVATTASRLSIAGDESAMKSRVGASSVMAIEQSPGPSPRTTIRHSMHGLHTTTGDSFEFERTRQRPSSGEAIDDASMARSPRRRTPRKEMLPEADGLYDRDERASEMRAMRALSVNESSQARGPSSPSPSHALADSSLRRRGLNAGLEARKQARRKPARRDPSMWSGDDTAQDISPGKPRARTTTGRLDRTEAADDASVASWPSPNNSQAIDLPNEEEDIVAFDGSNLSPSRRFSVADTGEDEPSMEMGSGTNQSMPFDVDQDAPDVSAEKEQQYDAGLDVNDASSDNEGFESSRSVVDSSIEEEEATNSEPSEEELGATDESEEAEASAMVEVTVDDTGVQYAYDEQEDLTPDATGMSGISADTTSTSRRVLSERDSNVSMVSQGGTKTKAKKSVTQKRRKEVYGEEDGDTTLKQRKTKLVDGKLVERVPSSRHRRDLAAMQRPEEDEGEPGARRSKRYRYKPLEYWRGERVRYGRMSLPKSRDDDGEGGGGARQRGADRTTVGDDTIDADAFEDTVVAVAPPVMVLKEIIRIPRAEGEGTFAGLKLPTKKDPSEHKAVRKARGARSMSASVEPDPTQPTRHAEEGMDKDTPTHALVHDFETGEDEERQIACTSAQLRPRMAEGCMFGFEKVFVVEDFMATGVLFLLVGGNKPVKNSKENYYTFTVLEGCVRVKLHGNSFLVAPQGMFFVPRGNDYAIENVSKRVARLSFTQAKRPSTEV